jgi:hypothetical protein
MEEPKSLNIGVNENLKSSVKFILDTNPPTGRGFRLRYLQFTLSALTQILESVPPSPPTCLPQAGKAVHSADFPVKNSKDLEKPT